MLAVLAVLALAGCDATSSVTQGIETPTSAATTASSTGSAGPVATASTTATGYPVQVFFSKHPASDSNPANVFPVSRVSQDINVATYAVRQLIVGPTAAETSQGYFTPLPSALTDVSNCGGADFQLALNMRGTTSEPGTATLRFCRQVASSGVVTDAHISFEVNKTLLQFSTIHKVVILNPNGSCFGDESGQNFCLQ